MNEPEPRHILVRMDLTGHSSEECALDLIVAMPVAVERLRAEGRDSLLAEQIIDSLCDHLRACDDPAKFQFAAGSAADLLYKHTSELSVMDRVTHAYCATVCRAFFDHAVLLSSPVFYILDNEIRDDRFEMLVELFTDSGFSVVCPAVDGFEWPELAAKLRVELTDGRNVLYVERDATVNHLDAVRQLAKKTTRHACYFRNFAPSNPNVAIIRLPDQVETRGQP